MCWSLQDVCQQWQAAGSGTSVEKREVHADSSPSVEVQQWLAQREVVLLALYV